MSAPALELPGALGPVVDAAVGVISKIIQLAAESANASAERSAEIQQLLAEASAHLSQTRQAVEAKAADDEAATRDALERARRGGA